MTLVSHRHRFAYLPVPKVACSSLKTLVFELETDGRSVPTDRQGKSQIHQIYPTRQAPTLPPWLGTYFTFAVVRDPVDRFVSGYRNRIRYHGDVDTHYTRRMKWVGLRAEPSIDEFFDRILLYQALFPRVRHHFAPQTAFIGGCIHQLDMVVDLANLATLEMRLSERLGRARTRAEVADRWFKQRSRTVGRTTGSNCALLR